LGFGHRRLEIPPRDVIIANHKRIYQLYRAAKLQVCRRKKARVAIARGFKRRDATRRNEIWAFDFVSDTIGTRSFRGLSVIDVYAPASYWMMPIARAATTTIVISEMMLWSITSDLARVVSGIASVGPKAVVVVKPIKR
jgi:hypothetical protein